MKNLSLIASIGKNRELGYQNDLIWKIKEDLKFFKEVTMGSYIIMGKNTYDSLPRSLPGRKYIVLTSNEELKKIENILVFSSLEEILDFTSKTDESMYYVIGGGQVYSSFLPYVDSMHLTEIDESFPQAQTYFPKFNKDEWVREESLPLEETGVSYKHVLYLRKK